MTTKTTISDKRTYMYSSCAGLSLLNGEYFEKTQSGTNSVPGQPLRENGYSLVVHHRNYPHYTLPSGFSCNVEAAGCLPKEVTVPWTSNDEIKLFEKLSAKWRGLNDDFNGGATLGEHRETLNLIGNTAVRISKALRSLRKLNFSQIPRDLGLETARRVTTRDFSRGKSFVVDSTKDLSNVWLEYQYGWKPLLSDVYNGAQAVASALNRPLTKTFRVRHQVKGNYVDSGTTPSVSYRYYYDKRKQWIATLVEEESPLGILGLDDPVSVAWELVPFSFVVDWFIPIGDYLEAVRFRQKAKVLQVTSTDFLRTTAIGLSGNASCPVVPDAYKDDVSMTRSILSSLPNVPLPSIKPIEKSLSLTHAISSIALLRNLI